MSRDDALLQHRETCIPKGLLRQSDRRDHTESDCHMSMTAEEGIGSYVSGQEDGENRADDCAAAIFTTHEQPPISMALKTEHTVWWN